MNSCMKTSKIGKIQLQSHLATLMNIKNLKYALWIIQCHIFCIKEDYYPTQQYISKKISLKMVGLIYNDSYSQFVCQSYHYCNCNYNCVFLERQPCHSFAEGVDEFFFFLTLKFQSQATQNKILFQIFILYLNE